MWGNIPKVYYLSGIYRLNICKSNVFFSGYILLTIIFERSMNVSYSFEEERFNNLVHLGSLIITLTMLIVNTYIVCKVQSSTAVLCHSCHCHELSENHFVLPSFGSTVCSTLTMDT